MREMTEAEMKAMQDMLAAQQKREAASRINERSERVQPVPRVEQRDEKQAWAEAETYGQGGKFGKGEVKRTTVGTGSQQLANNNER